MTTAIDQLDFDTLSVCRICLQNSEYEQDDSMQSIFERDPDSDLCLYEKIENCGGIKIINHPDLPTRICDKCRACLAIAHKFRIICKNSDDYLREYVVDTAVANGQESVESSDADSLNGIVEAIEVEDEGTPEYLMEYNPDTGDTMVTPFPPQDSVPDQTTIDYEEIDNYAELYTELLNDDEGVEQSELIEEEQNDHNDTNDFDKEMSIPRTPSPAPSNDGPTKTLGISSDGTAVIRVKTQRQLVKERCLHVCDVCGNAYPRKYVLEAHMRRHRDERPFECEICQQTFHMSCQLSRHMRKHTKLRPHMCQYCKRCFTDRSALLKHERIHRNERPYTCETCGKSFTYSSVLKVHQLTHSGEKQFSCGICSKRFARAHHLQSHLETLLHQDDPRSRILLQKIKKQSGKYRRNQNGNAKANCDAGEEDNDE